MNDCCKLSFLGKFCTEDGTTVLGFVHLVNGVPVRQYFDLETGLPYTGVVDIPDACEPLIAEGFLRVEDPLSTTLQVVKDNAGNESALNLATDKVAIGDYTEGGIGTAKLVVDTNGTIDLRTGINDILASILLGNNTGIIDILAQKLNVDCNAEFSSDVLVNGNISAFNLLSGSYLPTLTAVLNVTSTGAQNLTYSRVGNTVTVAGQIDIKAGGAGLATVGISLPVASNFATVFQAGGVGVALTGTGTLSANIQANATSNEVEIRLMAADTTTRTFIFSFTYQII